jgi:modulator of FtsH protease HflK
MNGPLDPLDPKHSRSEPAASSPPEPVASEDASATALSDALRSSFFIVKVLMVLLVIVFLGSGVFTVPSQEQAIILRFGKPVGVGDERLLRPGLHWSFPYPIDEVVRIPITEIQTVTSTAGWYATTPEWEAAGTEPEPAMLNPATEGYTLTGDTNIIHARATLRYRINNPLDYTLNFVNASNLVQNALNNALFHVAPQFNVDEALRLAVTEMKEKIVGHVRERVAEQGLGIVIEDAELRTVPPRFLRHNFNEVLNADLKRQELMNQARAYANRARGTADGEAQALINAGHTQRARLVESVAAEAKYFEDQLPYYRQNPDLFLARLHTETMHRVLTNAHYKVLRMDDSEREMRVQVTREPLRPPGEQPQTQNRR